MADWNGEIASREELRERKRRAALRVASRLFNEKGYHATSLDEIADRIGVTKTALYYYFRNKEELLFECIELSLDAGDRARMAEPDSAAALDRFRAFYLHFLTEVMRDGGSYTTKVNIRALPAAMQERVELRRNALRDHIAGLLEAAVAEGSVRPLDCLATANYLVMASNWLVAHPGEFPTVAHEAEQEAGAFLDQVLYGIVSGAGR